MIGGVPKFGHIISEFMRNTLRWLAFRQRVHFGAQRPARVTSCPGLPGTVPELEKISRVPASFIPGQ